MKTCSTRVKPIQETSDILKWVAVWICCLQNAASEVTVEDRAGDERDGWLWHRFSITMNRFYDWASCRRSAAINRFPLISDKVGKVHLIFISPWLILRCWSQGRRCPPTMQSCSTEYPWEETSTGIVQISLLLKLTFIGTVQTSG